MSLSIVLVPLMLAFGGAAFVIFWRRSSDWMALFFALMLLMFGATFTRSLYVFDQVYPALGLPVRVVWGLGTYSWMPILYLFPNGRFVPRWTRPLALGCIALPFLFPEFAEIFWQLPDLPPDVRGQDVSPIPAVAQ